MNDWSWRIGYVCKASAASSHRQRRIGVRRVEAQSAIRGRRSKKAVSLDLRASRIDQRFSRDCSEESVRIILSLL